ncbi:hypothetical protein [Microtetraspora malaysiensis]|uniref:hypothetical protein n=1 Tax=Microtetraspora malaysiensis TaxID=161358 RepID=UPI003D8DD1D3
MTPSRRDPRSLDGGRLRPPALRVLSLGMGVKSTALLMLAADGVIPRFDTAIFAHTGREPKEVMRHLDRVEAIAVEAGIPIVRVSVPGIRPDADPRRLHVFVPTFELPADGEHGEA